MENSAQPDQLAFEPADLDLHILNRENIWQWSGWSSGVRGGVIPYIWHSIDVCAE